MSTTEREANWAATLAVRQVLAQAKNPRTALGRMSPTGVAYHAALAAIEAHRSAPERLAGTNYRPPDRRMGDDDDT